MTGRCGLLSSPRVAWGVVAAYAVLLTYLLLAPYPLWIFGLAGDVAEQAVDRTITGYVQHGLAYALLAWLILWASGRTHGTWQLVGGLLAIAHGGATEWLQGFIPHRCADWSDALANTLGVAVGCLSGVLTLWILGKVSAKAAGPFDQTQTIVLE